MDSLVNYSLQVNEISFVKHQIVGESFNVDPKISRTITPVDADKAAVTYVLQIINTPEHPFPVDIVVSITGVFDVGKIEPKSVDDFLKIQTCQILLPHIRSIVSTLTSSALMPPLMLPIVDARKLFPEDKELDNNEKE